MGWSVGFDDNWQRDIGYGVPAYCDAPGCSQEIDRGISYVCGSDAYGGIHGCGLYFCELHLLSCTRDHGKSYVHLCPRCANYKPPYKRVKPDHPDWVNHKQTDPSWENWRKRKVNPSRTNT